MTIELNDYYSIIVQEKLHKNQQRLKIYLDAVFRTINFQNARVLDVGGGSGLFSFYAACRGAREVICLEPEIDGSTEGTFEKFKHVRRRLGLSSQVRFFSSTLQESGLENERFDIILLHNSINHLDEFACIHLLEEETHRNTYREIFAGLFGLVNTNGIIIACDCSCDNLYAHIHLKNPFAPQIEWHKHQTPETWAKLLQEVGFTKLQIYWTPFTRFYALGKWFTANKPVSYCLASHFCLKMIKE